MEIIIIYDFMFFFIIIIIIFYNFHFSFLLLVFLRAIIMLKSSISVWGWCEGGVSEHLII